MRVGSLVALLVVMLVPGVVRGQEMPRVVRDANFPPPAAHTHRLAYDIAGQEFQSAAFAPDRASIYVQRSVRVLNPWQVATSYWPELLGAGVGLFLVVSLVIARRIHARQQARGLLYCRRCNYDVTPRGVGDAPAAMSDICPECGASLRGRGARRGRHAHWRTAPLAVALVAVLGGYAWLHLSGTPREGWMSKRFGWLSISLAEFVERRVPYFVRHIDHAMAIDEVSLTTGEVVRTIGAFRGDGWEPMAVSPDGRTIVVRAQNGGLQLVDERGSGIRRPVLAEGRVSFPYDQVLGFDGEGARAYVAGALGSGWEIAEIELGTGRVIPCIGQRHEPGSMSIGRVFFKRDTQPASFLSLTLRAWSWNGPLDVQRHEVGQPTHHIHLGNRLTHQEPATVSGDGSTLCAGEEGRSSFVTFDLAGDAPPVRTDLLGQGMVAGPMVLNGNGSVLALGADGRILVRDIKRERWVAALAEPPGFYCIRLVFSPDERWIAGVYQEAARNAAVRELYLWNLGEILEQTEHAQPIESQSP